MRAQITLKAFLGVVFLVPLPAQAAAPEEGARSSSASPTRINKHQKDQSSSAPSTPTRSHVRVETNTRWREIMKERLSSWEADRREDLHKQAEGADRRNRQTHQSETDNVEMTEASSRTRPDPCTSSTHACLER